jgi:adenylate kinase
MITLLFSLVVVLYIQQILNTGSRRKEIPDISIGITGSPGTGKKTVARALSQLTGLRVISLNSLAIKMESGRKVNGEFVVNIQKLRRQKIPAGGRIIVGHLLSLVVPKSALDFVAILRCSPGVLRRRYLARGYSEEKIKENITAEVLDLVSYATIKKYGRGKVSEFDTTKPRDPIIVADRILQTIEGKRPKQYSIANWSERASRSNKSLLRILGHS